MQKITLPLTLAAILTLWACTNHIADSDSKVMVGPYPVENDISNLKSHGVTNIVSLLDPGIAYEDTLLKRELMYAKANGVTVINFQMPADSIEAPGKYNEGANAAVAEIMKQKDKVFLHSYLTSTRTQTVETMLQQKGVRVATYVLPRRSGSELTYLLDSAEAAYQASHFQEVITLLGNKPDLDRKGQLLVAWATYHLNKTEEAKRQFETVLKAHPDENEATIGIAYCDYREHDLPHADSLFQVAINAHEQDPSANAGLGLTRYEEGKYDDARKYLDVSLKTDSINVEAGQVRLRLNNMQKYPSNTASGQTGN